jgi:hypothetical protein
MRGAELLAPNRKDKVMKLETRKGSTLVRVEIEGDFATVTISGNGGMEKCSSVYAKDLTEKLEDFLKAYTYIKGAKSHHALAVKETLMKVGA